VVVSAVSFLAREVIIVGSARDFRCTLFEGTSSPTQISSRDISGHIFRISSQSNLLKIGVLLSVIRRRGRNAFKIYKAIKQNITLLWNIHEFAEV